MVKHSLGNWIFWCWACACGNVWKPSMLLLARLCSCAEFDRILVGGVSGVGVYFWGDDKIVWRGM